MTDNNTIALVTGANKGIGHAIATALGGLGWTVGIGARDDTRRAAAVRDLRAAGVDAFEVPLDVTDDASVTAAAALIGERAGRLDVLINNAAITGGWAQAPTETDLDVVRTVMETNVLGVIRVTDTMLPLLRRSASPRIVNMSSSVGSLTRQNEPGDTTGPLSMAYAPSKTFLNAVTVQYAKALRDTGILINMACPGFVKTDLNGHRGHRTPAEGAVAAVRLATLPDGGPTGAFFDEDGPIAW
ncbi:SDR family oxidoreductase [Actinoplanes couchii]|uniref:Dehydrogenase n=1 Tax=Actinoplanes couchii TaxID=403638 RepID=A0ABQ3XH11_9ACTN|nr:SDR family oxidoreductase [Actinoplanes couchii]MDR6320810.1 NAD(P)-dependent dehydrogenase (short-subunit alcohol dehydrogenase family) [Actinoplanes couchii]GID57705.1 dehydrogenase [Actinoplanes couchii]